METWHRQELYAEIWEQPLVKVAAKYGISAVALGKVCRKLQIPLPGRGYWTKKEFGKPVEKLPLPEARNVPIVHRLKFSPPDSVNSSPVPPQAARQLCELRLQTYPRDVAPHNGLGYLYAVLGQYDLALPQDRETVRGDPESSQAYANLIYACLSLNGIEEARATAEEARAKKLNSPDLRSSLYLLAFLRSDAAGMKQQVAESTGKPGVEDWFLGYEADTAAYSGRLAKARALTQQAISSAVRAEEKEAAARYQVAAALREALFGNVAVARQRVASAFGLSTGRDIQYGAALALALTGDAVRAKALADDLGKKFPEDTVVRFNYLPTLRSQLAVTRSDAMKGIEVLQAAVPYELGQSLIGDVTTNMYPVYVRGQAYLANHQSSEAAGEFQKILDHRGIVLNGPIGALAHLQIGRAYVMLGDTAKAKAAYQDFLTLWKEADSDIPVLKEAKAEYAKLQYFR